MALELNHELVSTEPVPAATVVVLRDGPTGPEVLMLRRHTVSGVLGGAFVFPGGKVDPALDTLQPQHVHATLDDLRQRLGEAGLSQDMAGNLFAAATRETLEECDLLLGCNGASPAKVACVRSVLRAGRSVGEALEAAAWRLDTLALQPWSRWITPPRPSVTNRRFDARFFVAALPREQTAGHDGHEITESTWMSPRVALQSCWRGLIELAAPQIITLQHLARFEGSAQVLAYAATHRPRTIRPETFEHAGHRITCYPGDPQHSDPVPAWEGPTRLIFRNGRFEPPGGLAALVA